MITAPLRNLADDSLSLFFPRNCPGCGEALSEKVSVICHSCFRVLPHTGFASVPGNPGERMFYGRCRADRVHAEFYFSKGHTVQRLIHALKYEGDRSAGRFLGRMMGHSMMESKRFSDIDVLLPLPLYLSREKERGYNQAVILCRGIQDRMPVPLLEGNLVRMRSTETQTRKDRTARWQNVENSFRVTDAKSLKGARILLVDDVITTGATLESCCEALAGAGPASISIAVAAIASK